MKMYSKIYQQGVGLIEVLVTLLVLSTALMALAVLQTRSLAFNHSSYVESQANIYAYDILDRIRLNASATPSLLTNYNIAADDATPTNSSPIALDIKDWRASIGNLPGGKGAINCVVTTRLCTITITWSEVKGQEISTDGNGTSSFTYSAML